ncbi:Protein translocase subunit SA2 [Ranunculus cassubicifolius]
MVPSLTSINRYYTPFNCNQHRDDDYHRFPGGNRGGHKAEAVSVKSALTGRVEEKRRWSDDIHQAVEAKEGLKIQADSVVVAQITYQSLFKLYPKLSGMTGTAKTEEKEFLKMYAVPVIEVPTNLPNNRVDLPIQVFATARGKWENAREEIVYMFRQGRPVLVGTTRFK